MTSSLETSTLDAFRQIDRVVSGQAFVSPEVAQFVQQLQTQKTQSDSLVLHIAQQLLRRSGESVFLFTGFVVPDRLPQGENDGPLGTLALARALHQAKLAPAIWVDWQLIDHTRWMAAELGVTSPVYALQSHELLELPHTPSAAIAIEKPGQNEYGVMHTFDGEAITGGSVAIDEPFLQWNDSDTLTLAIGDRGNEIGFGALRAEIEQLVPSSATCQCGCGGGVVSATPANLLLPAAVSNWGAYGLAAALSILTEDISLTLDPAEERRLLQVAAVRGCVDGIQRRGSFGVDGLSGETSVAVVRELKRIASAAIGL